MSAVEITARESAPAPFAVPLHSQFHSTYKNRNMKKRNPFDLVVESAPQSAPKQLSHFEIPVIHPQRLPQELPSAGIRLSQIIDTLVCSLMM